MKSLTIISIVGVSVIAAHAQQAATSPQTKKEKAAFTDPDSLSIFELIDSLINTPITGETGSSIVARLGYNSNIMSVNSGFAVNQFGLSPGVTYYHKSGLYVDAATYWSAEYSPSIFLSIPSLGYMKSIKKWTFNLEYSRYLYSYSSKGYGSPYTNSVSSSNFFDVKPFLFRLDYGFYFGDKNGHRIIPAISLNLKKKNWLGLSQMYFYPTFSAMFGNDYWQDYRLFSNPTVRFKEGKPLFYLKNFSEFGILDYYVSVPLTISLKDWSFQANYTYNFVQSLPGETLYSTNYGFLSFSIIKYFNFKTSNSLIDFYKLPK
ncbi:MAG: hypothetical protein JST43_01755 [Bacteroidetes bacterium]|nr:hypothetical protein [Bacteroidota bacterium]MBS1541946.1 hypothetical protein [Bacteroidota bacterium]